MKAEVSQEVTEETERRLVRSLEATEGAKGTERGPGFLAQGAAFMVAGPPAATRDAMFRGPNNCAEIRGFSAGRDLH
jgi:hypothetical protein